MRIEDKVGEEILGDLVATQHPYQSLQSRRSNLFVMLDPIFCSLGY